MAKTNYSGEAAAPEGALESDNTYTEQQSRLQDQRDIAMDLATDITPDSEQNEAG